MELRDAVVWLLVISGVVLVGYGIWINGEITHSIDARTVDNETQMRETVERNDERELIEYDWLSPEMQDLFREVRASENPITVTERPSFASDFVHYRDSYYLVLFAAGHPNDIPMFVSIASGLILIVAGLIGRYFVPRAWMRRNRIYRDG